MKAGHKITVFIIIAGWPFICGGKISAATEVKPAEGLTIEYKAEGLNDPFVEYETAPEKQDAAKKPAESKPLPALALEGMVWGGNYSQAIINKKVVRVGDVIDGAEIKKIDKDGVEVVFDGQSHQLASPASKNYGDLTNTKKGAKNEK